MNSVAAFVDPAERWLELAASALGRGIAPRDATFDELGPASLFALDVFASGDPSPAAIPPLFRKLARSVGCHRDPGRWAALYAVLWRLNHGEPELLSVVTDPMVHQLVQLHRGVKRAAHKMKAFVRFRRADESEDPRYVAWFEPAHDVVHRVAPFFARRFPSMRWSILTPDRCVHWDRTTLTYTDGVTRDAAPADDAHEDLWRTYYANIFNPARLNGRAMRAEMPVRYWKDLPEAKIIRPLQVDARRRVDQMLAQVFAEPEDIPADFAAESSSIDRETPPAAAVGWDAVYDPGVFSSRQRAEAVSSHPRSFDAGETRIDFGVAGWTDPTILAAGVFYPRSCATPEDRLRYYASRFSMVEVDATYYALPTRSMAAAWAARTPDDFQFDVKAHALMTGHPTDVRRLPDWIRRALPKSKNGEPRVYASDLPRELLDEVWARFREALEPLRSSGKLGAIMLQYPRWFTPTAENARALRHARELLGEDLATVELRNRDWMTGRIAERTIALLMEVGLSYVIVDGPQGMQSSMPPTIAITNPKLAVFRLHGRRVATWEARNDPVTERYRYLYDRAQLLEWAPKVRETAFNVARVHMTFNNNHANYATTNAAEMAQMFRES